jgi:hypothetical protein
MMRSMPGSSTQFARVCHALAAAARRGGLQPPSFRSPPRLDGAVRTVRQRGRAGAVVAVVVKGRPFTAVVADMIEGVVVANHLAGADAIRARSALWDAVAADLGEAAA